jgi:hypothetical protein
MNSNIFLQAIQITLYKKVHGWTGAFEYRAVLIALLSIALTLFSAAQDEVPDLDKADKRTGIILDILDAGRCGDKTLVVQEKNKTNGYSLYSIYSIEELQELAGQEAIVSTYDAASFFGLKAPRVLEIEAGGKRHLNKLEKVRGNINLYRGGFSFFAKGLLIVLFGIYLSLVLKLNKKTIIVEENRFVWAGK